MNVEEYTEEFYRLDIRFVHANDEVEKVERQKNSLRTSIQDYISYVKMESVEEAYQCNHLKMVI